MLDTQAVSANSVARYFKVDGHNLQRNYKNHLSGYIDWDQPEHSADWILFAENIGSLVCIDEVSLTQGELYTIVTNASAACQQGSLIALVKGTKSEDVVKVLERVPLRARETVQQVTVDLARNMEKIGRISFPKCAIISNRFHVQQLP